MKLKKNEVLVLRTVDTDMTTGFGPTKFTWPRRGRVTSPNWRDHVENTGLEGLPWGAGDSGMTYLPGPHLVIKVDASRDYRNVYFRGLGTFCQFKTGIVVYCGAQDKALALIRRHAPQGTVFNSIYQYVRDKCRQTAGSQSAQFGGDYAVQRAVAFSSQRAGNWSWQRAEDFTYQSAGAWATQLGNGGCMDQKCGHTSVQIAGSEAKQCIDEGSVQIAGQYSVQITRPKCQQKAGIDTVQIIRPYACGKLPANILTRVVTKKEADKWYKTTDKGWELCTKEEVTSILRRIDGVWKRG